jgi:hypothetical protein
VTDVLFRPRTGSRFLPSLVVLLGCAAPGLRAESVLPSAQGAPPSDRAKALKELPPPTKLTPIVTHFLTEVPEVEIQAAPRKVDAKDSANRIARMVLDIEEADRNEADGFIKILRSDRAEFAGLPFLLGDAARDRGERRTVFRQTAVGFRVGNGWNPEERDPVAVQARIAALMQMLVTESHLKRLELVSYLGGLSHPEAGRALARLAIYDPEMKVREAAGDALKRRPDAEYVDILIGGLRYPWFEVAENAADAIVRLRRYDLLPLLVDVLDEPDPRAPMLKPGSWDTFVVREVVRINHNRNCLLCHAPADAVATDSDVLTSPIPVPGEELTSGRYERQRETRSLIRVDVTYLRQDFSRLLPVDNAHPWPTMQRYDFLIRERTLTVEETAAFRAAMRQGSPGPQSPQRRAVLRALQRLTGADAGFTSRAWRQMLDLPEKESK